MMTSVFANHHFLVTLSILLQVGQTQTGVLKKLLDFGILKDDIQNIQRREDGFPAASSTCTCTCVTNVESHPVQNQLQTTPPEKEMDSEAQQRSEDLIVKFGGYGDTVEGGPIEELPSTSDDPFFGRYDLDNQDENLVYSEVDDGPRLDKYSAERYSGSWGHSSRYPWRALEQRMCIRQPCHRDSDCCYQWNICDRSANVCTDCWYGHPCLSERDCCPEFPFCQRKWKTDERGRPLTVEGGRCADQRR